MAKKLPDVQNHPDSRGVELEKVGITNLSYPLKIRDQNNGLQQVTAKLDILVGLHSQQRGAHLSHLISAFERYKTKTFGMDDLVTLLKDIRKKQDGEGILFDSAFIKMSFTYFIEKMAPESKSKSLVQTDYREKWQRKLQAYQQEGFVLYIEAKPADERILITTEDNPNGGINSQEIDHIVRATILGESGGG